MKNSDLEQVMLEEWNGARQEYHYPQLPAPVFDSEVPNGQINIEDHKTKINADFIREIKEKSEASPKADGEPLTYNEIFSDVLGHELTHFMRYPGSVLQILRQMKTANKLVDDNLANALRTAFVEAQTNIHMVKELENPITPENRRLVKPEDPLGNLMHGVYQEVWDIDIGIELNAEEKELVQQLSQLDYLNQKRELNTLRKFITILKDYAHDNQPQDEPSCGAGDAGMFSENELREGLRQFSKQSSPGEFEDLAKKLLDDLEGDDEPSGHDHRGSRAGVGPGTWSIAKNIYTALAASYNIPVKTKPLHKNGSVYPYSHAEFTVSDNLFDLDPYSSNGILPGVSKRWLRKEGETFTSGEAVPDSLIIIDNSGSMPNPDSGISVPVLGGTVVANTYLENGAKVAIYNFGGSDHFSNFSKDKESVHRDARRYTGGGTTFNPHLLKSIVEQSNSNLDISVISDMEISNLDAFVGSLLDLPATHRIHLLYSENNNNVTQLKQKFGDRGNVGILPLRQKSDIQSITMGELTKSVK